MTEGGAASNAGQGPGRRRAEKPSRRAGGNLGGVPRLPLPRISLQTRSGRLTVGGLAALLLLAWFVWYAMTPEKLPTTEKTVSASGVVDTPLYVGMFAPPDGFDRTLRISGVKVHATTSADIEVTPLLCRRGTVGVTSKPDEFCSDLVNPEGERMTTGDSIVLKLESAEPAIAVVDQIKVAYREDVRWDTQPAGAQQAIVTFAGRPEIEDGTATQ
ncbi:MULTISPECIES: hypothetical protein [unclassified Nocardioides]|uniref:hypothetical protein n=1 Tax=unclassified Nocardioides TaxID=2615069 RepID=UPI000702F462|nr:MULTISPECIES: hypothetical protein [unclassified Nocardioides]KRC48695.1 hypothetical protein ASE19_17280 [Nocardioides sp. Root79]KRC75095.1 hypothetical protein ASE20_19180 [Nocardioides sp. Root240]